MRILSVGHFDPCGVALRHRRYLRKLGIDYRMAVERAYWAEGLGADWVLGIHGDVDELRAFAAEADIIQFSPAIDQQWGPHPGPPRFDDADAKPFVDIDWSDPAFAKARRIAFFYGSNNAHANMAAYAEHYRARGMILATCSLDYAAGMGAEYLPSIVDCQIDMEPAELRRRGDDLKIIHSPTDSRVCSSAAFVECAKKTSTAPISVCLGIEHGVLLAIKRKHHAGFDHLRGAFSVNSLENAALGLVNLVGVRPAYRSWLQEHMAVTLPWPDVETMDDVERWLIKLRDDEHLTADLQQAARRWATTQWDPDRLAGYIQGTYRGIIEGRIPRVPMAPPIWGEWNK